MKHYPLILRKIHHTLRISSSCATLCLCIASLIFVFLAINCGPPPQSQFHVPESAIQAADRNVPERAKKSQETGLPESAIVRLERMPYLRNAFKGPPPPTNSRTGLEDFYARTRATVQHAAVISGGSLEVLKAFIANGWAPIVMIRLQERNREILPLSQYNDHSGEVYLKNPTNLSERRVGYEDFEKTWTTDSRNKCVLITTRRLSEVDIERVLGKYLPAETFQQVSIRSR